MDAVQVLCDPKKVEILRAFQNSPRSTRDVATELGIKPPTLYHHVSQFVSLGLLVVVNEVQRRGAVERYFQTAARRLIATAGIDHQTSRETIYRERFEHALRQMEQASQIGGPEDTPIGMQVSRVRLPVKAVQRILGRAEEYARAFEAEDGIDMALMVVAYPEPEEIL